MNTSTIVIIVIGGLLLLLVLYVIGVYNKLVNAFIKDYGSYHFSYTSTEPDIVDGLFDSFFRLF